MIASKIIFMNITFQIFIHLFNILCSLVLLIFGYYAIFRSKYLLGVFIRLSKKSKKRDSRFFVIGKT